jgi:hypothetical protein
MVTHSFSSSIGIERQRKNEFLNFNYGGNWNLKNETSIQAKLQAHKIGARSHWAVYVTGIAISTTIKIILVAIETCFERLQKAQL